MPDTAEAKVKPPATSPTSEAEGGWTTPAALPCDEVLAEAGAELVDEVPTERVGLLKAKMLPLLL